METIIGDYIGPTKHQTVLSPPVQHTDELSGDFCRPLWQELIKLDLESLGTVHCQSLSTSATC